LYSSSRIIQKIGFVRMLEIGKTQSLRLYEDFVIFLRITHGFRLEKRGFVETQCLRLTHVMHITQTTYFLCTDFFLIK
jgi:hypothetical protein